MAFLPFLSALLFLLSQMDGILVGLGAAGEWLCSMTWLGNVLHPLGWGEPCLCSSGAWLSRAWTWGCIWILAQWNVCSLLAPLLRLGQQGKWVLWRECWHTLPGSSGWMESFHHGKLGFEPLLMLIPEWTCSVSLKWIRCWCVMEKY